MPCERGLDGSLGYVENQDHSPLTARNWKLYHRSGARDPSCHATYHTSHQQPGGDIRPKLRSTALDSISDYMNGNPIPPARGA